MNENIKNVLKVISVVVIGVIAVLSIYQLIKKAKERDFLPIVMAMRQLDGDKSAMVDFSGKANKFLLYDTPEGRQRFKGYLLEKGYRYVAKYGRSELYDYADAEVVVKQSNLFNRYLLCEIYNESYMLKK